MQIVSENWSQFYEIKTNAAARRAAISCFQPRIGPDPRTSQSTVDVLIHLN